MNLFQVLIYVKTAKESSGASKKAKEIPVVTPTVLDPLTTFQTQNAKSSSSKTPDTKCQPKKLQIFQQSLIRFYRLTIGRF
jgi:hypothetical protein